MEKNAKLLSNCFWKPLMAAILTATISFIFDFGKTGGLMTAIVIGSACGLSLYLEIKKYIRDQSR